MLDLCLALATNVLIKSYLMFQSPASSAKVG